MITLLKNMIKRLPYIKNLHQQIKKQGSFPAGHYYSPIPDQEEVLAYLASRKSIDSQLPGIKPNEETQLSLLKKYKQFYNDLPFPEKKTADYRYYYDNEWYSYGDAIFLYSFLREHQPKKIIEVGSGFSSAVILDTVDQFFTFRPDITFIEPHPERLNSLLKSGDSSHINIIDKKIQDIGLSIFSPLRAGDFLFIDSSHVVKCGSDLQILLFDVLPQLPSGVFVHFHDIFYPFEYPVRWLKDGLYWNENYFLKAFLSYNNEWSIYFFNDYVMKFLNDFISAEMPLCTKNMGGGLYIRKDGGC